MRFTGQWLYHIHMLEVNPLRDNPLSSQYEPMQSHVIIIYRGDFLGSSQQLHSIYIEIKTTILQYIIGCHKKSIAKQRHIYIKAFTSLLKYNVVELFCFCGLDHSFFFI